MFDDDVMMLLPNLQLLNQLFHLCAEFCVVCFNIYTILFHYFHVPLSRAGR